MKEFWEKFKAWKYHKYALIGGAVAVVVIIAIIIALCVGGDKPADPTTPTTEPSSSSSVPTSAPTSVPTSIPTSASTGTPSSNPTGEPTIPPTSEPTSAPTVAPTIAPTVPSTESANGITFYKTASHSATHTVTPGKTVTYSIILANKSNQAKTVSVTDQIPAVAEYVGGCDQVSDSQMKWDVTLQAGEKKTVTYTLKAKDDEANLGKAFDGIAKVDGVEAPCHKIYVERTLGNVDQQLMETAIDAFRQYTGLEDINLLKMIWNVAMSKSVSYNDSTGNAMTPAQILTFIYTGEGSIGGSEGSGEEVATAAVDFTKAVIPTLFGGKGVTATQASKFNGIQATAISAADLMSGDTFFVQESESDTVGKIYIYNGKRLFQIANGVIDVDTDAVLTSIPSAYRFAGLRFSFVIANRKDFSEDRVDTFTEVQKAIVAYAESMILRGDRAQYEAGSTMAPDTRYEYATNSPEDYTSDSWRYYNCSMLTFDSYYFGLGLNTGNNHYTGTIITSAKNQKIYYYATTGNETEAEKQAQADKFYAALQPGDTIVLRRKNNSGHALLYAGNGIVIHSTGGSYLVANSSRPSGAETYEATVRYLNVYDFFDPKCDNGGAYSYFVFGGQVTQLGIYRPHQNWNGTIPAEAQNRVNNLQGIAVEKVASKWSGQTVNIGEELTYTFRFLNTNEVDKTLDITDSIPAGTTLLSAPGAIANGTSLSWTVTIPAGEKLEISYTVKVSTNVPDNKLESQSAKVGGVSVRSSTLFVANTLTAAQQQKIIDAVKSLSGSSKKGLELANEIYKTAFGVDNIFAHTDLTTYHGQLFEKKSGQSKYSLIDNLYGAMAAPGLYGGRNFYCNDEGKYDRITRLAREENLVVGDIFFSRTSTANGLHIYLGDGICWSLTSNKADTVSVATRLERFVGYGNYWVILRPSMTLDI